MEAHSILAVILHVDLSHVIAWFDVSTCVLRVKSVAQWLEMTHWSHREPALCRYNWHSAGSLGWTFPMLKH